MTSVAEYLRDSYTAAWFSNHGPCAQQLEARLSSMTSAEAVLTANGTAGLSVALHALARPKRLVILPSFTFVAMPAVVSWAGLQPLFVDIEPAGWHVDPDHLALLLQEHHDDVAAVMVGSSFGIPPPSELTREWEALARQSAVPLIVDSAAGFGAVNDVGEPLGTQGDVEVFSFHATKPFAVGEGGLLSTQNRDLANVLRRLTNFGFDDTRRVGEKVGTNAKMSEFHAAVGLATLETWDTTLAKRRSLADRYTRGLAAGGWKTQIGSTFAAWQFVPALAPDRQARDAAAERAQECGIETRAYYEPVHALLHDSLGQDIHQTELPNTQDIARRSLSLPLATSMSEEDVDWVLDVVLNRSAEAGLASPFGEPAGTGKGSVEMNGDATSSSA